MKMQMNVKENRWDNQEWTIQRQCMQHWVHKTQERMDNPETMHATLGTQDTGQRQTKQNTQNRKLKR
jgi:hypothetical protein